MTDTTKQADRDSELGFAIMKHLGPAALTGGKMSPLEAFQLGWKARKDMIAPIQAEPVGEVEDAEDSIVTWFVEPTDGMLLYTHPSPALTAELKGELLEILSEVTDPYAKVDGDQPKVFVCHHNSEPCMVCEGMVKRWKLQKKIQAAIIKLTNLG